MTAKRRQGWISAAAVLGAIALATPAAAVQTVGYQTVVDFEELAAGTTGFNYPSLDTFISGGVATDAASIGAAAHSGTQVYVGTSILSQQTNGNFDFTGVDLWPAIGAWVSPGAAAVTATFLGYDPASHSLVTLGTAQTSGPAPNQFLSFLWSGSGSSLIDVRFKSSARFAIDDLTLGLPDTPFGIPEPATWALAVTGLFAAGVALRSRAQPRSVPA